MHINNNNGSQEVMSLISLSSDTNGGRKFVSIAQRKIHAIAKNEQLNLVQAFQQEAWSTPEVADLQQSVFLTAQVSNLPNLHCLNWKDLMIPSRSDCSFHRPRIPKGKKTVLQ